MSHSSIASSAPRYPEIMPHSTKRTLMMPPEKANRGGSFLLQIIWFSFSSHLLHEVPRQSLLLFQAEGKELVPFLSHFLRYTS